SRILAVRLISDLRSENIRCDTDYLNRSVKSQMKEANRQNAEYVIVLGEEEIRTNSFKLKKMSDGTEKQISDLSEINSRLLV
ncbi:MAG: histidine--tRNA ligase, partial [Ignavibacteria bacterium]|nr:histidine--tRNA ligase [Ignavibacteria bacterium]